MITFTLKPHLSDQYRNEKGPQAGLLFPCSHLEKHTYLSKITLINAFGLSTKPKWPVFSSVIILAPNAFAVR